MLAGASAGDMSMATTVSSSVVEYNHLQHAVNIGRFLYSSYRLANQIRNIDNALNPAITVTSNTFENIEAEENKINPLINHINIDSNLGRNLWLNGINDIPWSTIDSDLKLPNILENSKHSKGNKSNVKSQQKVFSSPAPLNNNNNNKNKRDDENKKQNESNGKERYKYTNYEKGDDIGIGRFTEKGKNRKLTDPKSGQYLEPDRARNSGEGTHGPSYWKLRGRDEKLIGTVSEDGRFIKGPPK